MFKEQFLGRSSNGLRIVGAPEDAEEESGLNQHDFSHRFPNSSGWVLNCTKPELAAAVIVVQSFFNDYRLIPNY